MRSTLYSIAVFAGVAVLGLGAVWCLDRLEMISQEYDDYGAASPSIEAGWLPRWLPESAKRIQEAHDIDTNEGFAVFHFDTGDHFHAVCEPLPVERRIFPETLRGFPGFANDALERVHASEDLDFFGCRGRSLAVDSEKGIAYVWSPDATARAGTAR